MWSKRNYLFNSDKFGNLLYIGNSNSLIKIDDILKDQIFRYRDQNKLISKKYRDTLQDLGAIVDSDEDILNRYKFSRMKLYEKSGMVLWISLTQACNFKCIYCFENEIKQSKIIEFSTIDKIVGFVSNSHISGKISVNIYGGEPLLCVNQILILYEKLLNINKNIDFFITTNGYLLTKENIEKLSTINKLRYQVTIDGLKNIHNLRRPHKIKSDSFDVIVNNLDCFYEYNLEKNPKPIFDIRMNVDKVNMDDFHLLWEYFHLKYGNFFNIYSTRVYNYCSNAIGGTTLLSPEEYSHFIIDNYEKYGIYENCFPKFGSPRFSCGAGFSNFYAIDSEGNFYKCPADIGEENKIAFNISNEKILRNDMDIDYSIKSDRYTDPICKDCFLLFNCDTCAKLMLNSNKNGGERVCNPLKYFTKTHFEMYYEYFMVKRNKV